ncbi:FAD-dependent oxidoreductase [Chlorobium phaeobacteroides]|jgi:prolycopene isomerase|uniref:Amine oxidase n=1 Tax=Chlorobium phaeobacteroides (strain DSM 266 / SMG 266 / 2430) TaxID=290317 RepID=A1BEU5_CHLPD|nr:FAD-dependent oxidoreductase [Chlorobium phaeobacteroides]ABL64922.1 amine oxidase [Chlorobium phaeobacteroides DSM 266]MBV5326161.1 NAD(P)-binding protein [Chlorobium sp.]
MHKSADVIIVGSGIGGLTVGALLQQQGISTLVFEQNSVPGGSCSSFSRNGYRFDAGASVFYGFGDDLSSGTLNLHTRIFRKLGIDVKTVHDPVQIHYHLPGGFALPAHYSRKLFLDSLQDRFPHEGEGIKKFYDELEAVYDILSSLPAGSLEDLMHLAQVGLTYPGKTFTLAMKTFRSMGKTARKYISDEELLRFIDIESYSWALQNALSTPLVNAGICLADRHHGGINYPVGGSGVIAEGLVRGIEKYGGTVRYRSEVVEILVEGGSAHGVKLANGECCYADVVVSNATVWDTFNRLVPDPRYHVAEEKFQRAPSWFQLYLGVDGSVIPEGFHVHHVLVEDWKRYDQTGGTIYFSAPTLLDPSLAPSGKHIVHLFVTAETSEWESFEKSNGQYLKAKEAFARTVIARTEKILPGLADSIELQVFATPSTHERYLNRYKGSYGPLLWPGQNVLQKPQNLTRVKNLLAVGDSTFPGQGVIAVTYSGVSCASYIARQMGKPLAYL